MYKLTGLNDSICNYEGKAITLPYTGEELTTKKCLVAHCGNVTVSKNFTSMHLIPAFDIGLKIHNAENGEVSLEKADYDLLKKIVHENPLYSALVMGPTFKYIDNIQNVEATPE